MNNIEALLPFYALDTLSDSENAQVAAWLADNPAAQAELAEMYQVTDQLAVAVKPIAPPPSIKSTLMQQIANDPRTLPAKKAVPTRRQPAVAKKTFWQKIRQRQSSPAFTALGFAMAAFAIIYAFTMRGQLDTLRQQNELLSAEISQQQASLATLQVATNTLSSQLATLGESNETLATINQEIQARIAYDEQMLAIYTAPTWEVARIVGTEFALTSSGYIVLDPESDQAVLAVSELEPLSTDFTYQLWLIRDDETRVSAGIFDSDPEGNSTHIFATETFNTFEAIGVSIEPAGGSEQPTGATVMRTVLYP